MELRKYPEADIRKKTDIYFMIGLAIALGATLGAFSYSSRDKVNNIDLVSTGSDDVEEMAPITRQQQPPPPPPPPPQTIDVVADDAQTEDPTTKNDEVKQDDIVKPIEEQIVTPEDTKEPEVFVVVEDMPEFPGGANEMTRFILENLDYPPLAQENGIQGKVMVEFIVDEHGNIKNAKVVKGIGWGCDEAALKVVNKMPKWSPGKQRNKPVRVRFVLPIKFQLQ
ncbi:MAG TPA: energy transducer TonB [Bacteroidetes bacterium]|nr:energy transducer TonB [Bacteroidota bacterium]